MREAERLILFIHVPKTAGTALRMWLVKRFANQGIYPSQPLLLREPTAYYAPTFYEHMPAAWDGIHAVCGHLRYPEIAPRLDRPLFRMTLLREPRARALSELRHHDRLTRPGLLGGDLLAALEQEPELVSDATHMFGDGLEDAWRNLKTFEWVGLQERLPESLEKLGAAAGWGRVPAALTRYNAGEAPEAPRITPEVDAWLSRRLRDEIELYERAAAAFSSSISGLRKRPVQ